MSQVTWHKDTTKRSREPDTALVKADDIAAKWRVLLVKFGKLGAKETRVTLKCLINFYPSLGKKKIHVLKPAG